MGVSKWGTWICVLKMTVIDPDQGSSEVEIYCSYLKIKCENCKFTMSLTNVYISFFIFNCQNLLFTEISTKAVLFKVYKASKQLKSNEFSAQIRLLRHMGHVVMALSHVTLSKWRFTKSFFSKCDNFT